VRHAHQVGIPAGQLQAEVARAAHAQVVVAALAGGAGAAADPGVDHHALADRQALHLGADLDHLAADLVAQVTGSFTPAPRSSDDSLPPPMSKPPAWMCRSEWHMPQCVTRT
jgi:hypothetical protein